MSRASCCCIGQLNKIRQLLIDILGVARKDVLGYSERKEFALRESKFFPFRVAPIWKRDIFTRRTNTILLKLSPL